jgi:CRISPR-associated protein Cmr1
MRATAEMGFEITLASPAFAGWVKRGKQGNGPRSGRDIPHHPVDPCGIRIPSLRGVLEFWHRSRLGELSAPQVFAGQRRVFGSADSGQGLTLRPEGRPEFRSGELRFEREHNAMLYLGYGPLQLEKVPRPGKPGNDSVATSYNRFQRRDAILAGPSQAARFRFVARGTANQQEELKRALVLLHLFGGIGARSRRGWGSVMVSDVGVPQTTQRTAIKDWFEQAAQGALSGRPPGVPGTLPLFTAFSAASRAFLTEVHDRYEDVLIDFFKNFQRVRSFVLDPRDVKRTAVKDHAIEVADARRGAGAVTAVPARLAFGMPFIPQHPRRRNPPEGWSIEYRGRLPGRGADDSDDVTRRGSPLLLKVFRLADRSYVGVALFLQSSFFGDPNREVSAKGGTANRPFPGYGAVTELLDGSGWTEISLR